MKTLSLVRHAKSSWDHPNLSDRDRPLNRRGERDAPIMGQRILESGVRPSLIVSSPAKRAWTTAKKIAKAISYPREFLQRDDRVYLAGVRALMEVVGEQDNGFNNIMIVGHNPGLTDFANLLVPNLTPNLPTCGFVAVEIDIDSWQLGESPSCKLRTYDYPKRERID